MGMLLIEIVTSKKEKEYGEIEPLFAFLRSVTRQ
jgi:hypothetical protein